jgi:predicted nucleotide-binding protein (sugar kinase/HSP70/actin superfamily)
MVQQRNGVSLVPIESLTDRLAAERERLRREAGLSGVKHFQRPQENPFLAHERGKVTILFGGLTWKHEELIKAVFRGNGYRCERLPNAVVADFQAGKEYGNNGQCNPTYFTVGNLVRFLQSLEEQGVARQEIIDNYVFFTAGSCGPCRFGMYEAEYRFALQNAGFDGFRVLLFQQTDGIKAASGEPGLKFSVNFGMGMLNALNLGDVINDLVYQIRPYEVNYGESDRIFKEAVDGLVSTLRDRHAFEFMEDAPAWLTSRVGKNNVAKNTLSILCKIYDHLYGKGYLNAIAEYREKLNSIEVDRTRVKPIVKITGEFWAQTTESDGNFNMFRFLEREGAQVLVEPIATWVSYMMHVAGMGMEARKDVEAPYRNPQWWELHKRLANDLKFRKKMMALGIGEVMWTHFYHRVVDKMGGLTHHLVPQKELVHLAHPFYHQLARGGEGYMEVGKNVYYTINHLCHMVLALKPFGCMPSAQSDGVQSAVINRFKEMIFLPIETSGEGEVNAHSRVQMALGEAKAKARGEFETALGSTGKRLEDIRDYIADHPELKRPFYHVPHRPGIAGTGAQFVLHVSDLMDGRLRAWRRSRVAVRATQQAA